MTARLENCDFTLIIDKSGSMYAADAGGMTRFDAVAEATMAVADEMLTHNPEGIKVYLFSDRMKRYRVTKPVTITKIFAKNTPGGGTALTEVLDNALKDYFSRKSKNKTKENGEIIVIITDGVPNRKKALKKLIVQASKKLEPKELGIRFFQVGTDPEARKYLKGLEKSLVEAGAKHNLVNTKTMDEIDDMLLSKAILGSIKE